MMTHRACLLLGVAFWTATMGAAADMQAEDAATAAGLASDDECSTQDDACALNALQIKAQADQAPYHTSVLCVCRRKGEAQPLYGDVCAKEYQGLALCNHHCHADCKARGYGIFMCANGDDYASGWRGLKCKEWPKA